MIINMIQRRVREEADRLAKERLLGALLQTNNSGNGENLLVIGILLILIGLFISASGLFLLTSLKPITAPLFLTILGACLIVVGVFCLRKRIRVRHSREFIYEYGLVMVDCYKDQLRASEAIHWREIAQIWHTVICYSSKSGQTSTSHTYRFQRLDGSYLGDRVRSSGARSRARDFDQDMGPRIEWIASMYLLPQAEACYRLDLPVTFGPITVTAEGIVAQGIMLPWQQVKQVSLDESHGLFVIQRLGEKWWHNPWARIAYKEIPNLAVLNALVQQIVVPVGRKSDDMDPYARQYLQMPDQISG